MLHDVHSWPSTSEKYGVGQRTKASPPVLSCSTVQDSWAPNLQTQVMNQEWVTSTVRLICGEDWMAPIYIPKTRHSRWESGFSNPRGHPKKGGWGSLAGWSRGQECTRCKLNKWHNLRTSKNLLNKKKGEKKKGRREYASLDGCVVQWFGKSNTGFDKHQKARKPGVRQRPKRSSGSGNCGSRAQARANANGSLCCTVPGVACFTYPILGLPAGWLTPSTYSIHSHIALYLLMWISISEIPSCNCK